MAESQTVRFDQAWARANAFVSAHPDLDANHVVLIRDLYGRIRVALDDRNLQGGIPGPEARRGLAESLDKELRVFSPGTSSLFLLASEMFAPDEVFETADTMWADPTRKTYRILDRYVVGSDWLRSPFETPAIPRVTLYGIKGGVGRSTATAVLAWRLSQAGRRVLVIDLDLESPGVGATILPAERAPDFGVVDWFVEDGVGQADEALLRDMVASSPLGAGGADLVVVPSSGRSRDGYTYLSKLARAYAELSGNLEEPSGFGARLHRLVLRLEEMVKPDVTLLDSRAGLHDIAAVAVTRMGATSLLFGVDSAQTWEDYRSLFQAWRLHFDRAERFREDLKMVAAQIPETETTTYLESFQQCSYNLFADNLYVETPPGEELGFNFDLNDADAPHTPLRIHWSRTFQQFDPVRRPGAVTDEQVRAAFGDFVRGVSLLVFGEPVPW
jgi:CobQ/CobB/MinD/ParA nucleotide binding domain